MTHLQELAGPPASTIDDPGTDLAQVLNQLCKESRVALSQEVWQWVMLPSVLLKAVVAMRGLVVEVAGFSPSSLMGGYDGAIEKIPKRGERSIVP
ncbi:hypothetical protein COCNU_scaffold019878G000010 [Cocos nucifera]|nr:hypothetical protein [Cocos nucifera]